MFDFINHALTEQGVHPLQNTKKAISENKGSSSENTLKESDISFNELDTVLESAIKETAGNLIMESMVLTDSEKLIQTNAINRSKVDNQFADQFMQETVGPIIDTIGTLTEDARLLYTVKNPKNVKAVSLPVYEVALTIEAARRGALTEDSLNFTIPVKEDVDPTIMDLHGATAEASASKSGKVDENEQSLGGLVDQDEAENYDFGLKAVKQESYDPHDQHQYEDNDSKMYELDKGKEPNQNGMFEDDPDFKSDAAIKPYEGETAGDPSKGGNFPDRTMPVSEGSRLARYMFGEDSEVTNKVVYIPNSDSGIKNYEGELAGEEGEGANASDEFEGDGSSDEAIIEGQIWAARHILGQIFAEYGIGSQDRQKAIVREAIHYIFKHGVTNLFPATSDVATLVVEQNNISELDNHFNAKAIVESTEPVLTEAQEALIQEKSVYYLNLLNKSQFVSEGAGQTKADVMKAINFVTSASLIERTRQAFRCRMHHFSEEVKAKVSEDWALVNNLSESANVIKDKVTLRKYVYETAELKDFFAMLKEDSPVYKPCWKKAVLNNDNLTTACIYTEVVSNWIKLKSELYNGTSLQEKKIALETMLQLHETYLNLCTAMRDNSKAKQLIEGHSFRLKSLKEKVDMALAMKS